MIKKFLVTLVNYLLSLVDSDLSRDSTVEKHLICRLGSVGSGKWEKIFLNFSVYLLSILDNAITEIELL